MQKIWIYAAMSISILALGILGQDEDSITWLDKALAIDPNNSIALNNKVLALDALYKTNSVAKVENTSVEIVDETFSAPTLHVGDNLTVTGLLQPHLNQTIRASLSLLSNSTNATNIWEFLERDPPGLMFTIEPLQIVPYSITFKALEPGIYHLQTQLNVEHDGATLGPGHIVLVS